MYINFAFDKIPKGHTIIFQGSEDCNQYCDLLTFKATNKEYTFALVSEFVYFRIKEVYDKNIFTYSDYVYVRPHIIETPIPDQD